MLVGDGRLIGGNAERRREKGRRVENGELSHVHIQPPQHASPQKATRSLTVVEDTHQVDFIHEALHELVVDSHSLEDGLDGDLGTDPRAFPNLSEVASSNLLKKLELGEINLPRLLLPFGILVLFSRCLSREPREYLFQPAFFATLRSKLSFEEGVSRKRRKTYAYERALRPYPGCVR